VGSLNLPNKIELEITDSSGRSVYRKRQNIYYVKLQERVATLDAEKDYELRVTTVAEATRPGVKPVESSQTVIIHNKHYVPEKATEEEVKPPPKARVQFKEAQSSAVSSRVSTPAPVTRESSVDTSGSVTKEEPQSAIESNSLELALKEFIEEIDLLSSAPVSPAPKAKVDEEVEPVTSPEPKDKIKRGLVLTRKLAIPEVQFRWQRGFRKASNGRYVKVPILRLSLDFDRDLEMLPPELQFTARPEDARADIPVSNVRTERVSQNRSSCEFQVDDCAKAYVVSVRCAASSVRKDDSVLDAAVAAHVVPEFLVRVPQLREEEVSVWKNTTPVLALSESVNTLNE
jgi:hypothetical protein